MEAKKKQWSDFVEKLTAADLNLLRGGSAENDEDDEGVIIIYINGKAYRIRI